MKKTVLIAACLLTLLLLCSCRATQQNQTEVTETMHSENEQTVTVINEVKEADIWLLPDTEANRKTTLWGTATAAKVSTGESRTAPLCEAGDNGHYLLRMIDSDSFYYSANDISLKAGDTLTIKGNEDGGASAAVTDESGKVLATYDVFSARL
ncbi:MAG: hypothetical protein IJI67_01365 [Clostridia bacterium]|nr:hypothetical protein [Clostridia bacterium]